MVAMIKARPSFPYFYLKIAKDVSERGDCRRRQIGCVLVDQFHMAIFGYNGTDGSGVPGCLDGACPRGLLSFEECPPYSPYTNCIAVHAEDNVLRKARASGGFILPNSVAYVTQEPCGECYKLLVDAGVGEVYWLTEGMFGPGGSPGYANLYDPDTLRDVYHR